LPDLFVNRLPKRAIKLKNSENKNENEEDLEPTRKMTQNEDQQMAKGPRTILINEIINLAAKKNKELLAPATPGVITTWAAKLQNKQKQNNKEEVP